MRKEPQLINRIRILYGKPQALLDLTSNRDIKQH